MAAYNFKAQFEPAIMADLKLHTIRAERKDGRRPVPGEVLSLYVGMRTKQCRLLKRRRCAKVQEIFIHATEYFFVMHLDGIRLDRAEQEQLAKSDGFADLDAMFEFWIQEHRDKQSPLQEVTFTGAMIHWESDEAHRRRPIEPARKHRPATTRQSPAGALESNQ